ncbi:hypothetical protein PHMEG_0008334 [Phytophthora megakarya]|uniref:MULE transposase domain-containing protein n=1 Tax=Phytophthora megakarya TaxID=4795 RepID=A0A225WKP2_9STRA|nr:hypothetical protein PHMEG_0008334 [Phytophthora megakarya]
MVHDFATDIFLPVFFVLCTSKPQDMYWNVINAVAIVCNEKILPETVVCDFESALMDAVSVQFKDARVVGCYFHFKQACKRHIETKVMIASDAVKIAMAPGFLGLLTVIPQHKIGGPGVRCVTRKIQARCLELSVVYSRRKFWRYFKKTWLKKYKPQDWNVHDIDKPLFSRTNNPLERFNRQINAAVGSSHPILPRFVSAIDSLSARYVQRLEDTSKLRSPKRRRRTPVSCYRPDDVELPSDGEDANENGEDAETSSDDDARTLLARLWDDEWDRSRTIYKRKPFQCYSTPGSCYAFLDIKPSFTNYLSKVKVLDGQATLTDDGLTALVIFKRSTEAVVVIEQRPVAKDGFTKRTLKRRNADAKMAT